MSRVDDDRDAARVATRLAEAKRTAEGQKNKKAAEGNAFSKLVAGQKQEAQVKQEGNLARSAIAQMLGQADEKQVETGKDGLRQRLHNDERVIARERLLVRRIGELHG